MGGDLHLLAWPASKLSDRFLTWVYCFWCHLRIPSWTFWGWLLVVELNSMRWLLCISRKEVWMPCNTTPSALLLPFSCSIYSTFSVPALLKTKPEVCRFALGEVVFSLVFGTQHWVLSPLLGFEACPSALDSFAASTHCSVVFLFPSACGPESQYGAKAGQVCSV